MPSPLACVQHTYNLTQSAHSLYHRVTSSSLPSAASYLSPAKATGEHSVLMSPSISLYAGHMFPVIRQPLMDEIAHVCHETHDLSFFSSPSPSALETAPPPPLPPTGGRSSALLNAPTPLLARSQSEPLVDSAAAPVPPPRSIHGPQSPVATAPSAAVPAAGGAGAVTVSTAAGSAGSSASASVSSSSMRGRSASSPANSAFEHSTDMTEDERMIDAAAAGMTRRRRAAATRSSMIATGTVGTGTGPARPQPLFERTLPRLTNTPVSNTFHAAAAAAACQLCFVHTCHRTLRQVASRFDL
jgi:hypothetical protein